MRDPGAGELPPGQAAACVHHWQRLRENAHFVCRHCGAERDACPHDWLRTSRAPRWRCHFCAAVRPPD
jgi:hypothetical protein